MQKSNKILSIINIITQLIAIAVIVIEFIQKRGVQIVHKSRTMHFQ
ncbi:hypothetical protein [Staphylococcus agnetis]|nr:hypothetical protein [Staphylococcus agnetis]NJH66013.1 hypothetical protein [Staphylococcus agnetis]